MSAHVPPISGGAAYRRLVANEISSSPLGVAFRVTRARPPEKMAEAGLRLVVPMTGGVWT